MKAADVSELDVTAVMAGASVVLPLRDGSEGRLWFDGTSVRLHRIAPDVIMGLGETTGEGEASETPPVVSQ